MCHEVYRVRSELDVSSLPHRQAGQSQTIPQKEADQREDKDWD